MLFQIYHQFIFFCIPDFRPPGTLSYAAAKRIELEQRDWSHIEALSKSFLPIEGLSLESALSHFTTQSQSSQNHTTDFDQIWCEGYIKYQKLNHRSIF